MASDRHRALWCCRSCWAAHGDGDGAHPESGHPVCAALSLGFNIVVGFAGLLDLGYIAFYAGGRLLLRASRSRRTSASTCRCGRSCRSAPRWRACLACCWARRRSSCAATRGSGLWRAHRLSHLAQALAMIEICSRAGPCTDAATRLYTVPKGRGTSSRAPQARLFHARQVVGPR